MKVFPQVNKDHDYRVQMSKISEPNEVLFLYNSEDLLTTIGMGHQLASVCEIPYRFEVFTGQHLEAISKEKPRYVEVLDTFYS